jgi:CLIP-associating protein 1/2
MRIEPLYGLTTMHAALRTFQTEPLPAPESEDIKASSNAFGLLALGKFILRLPAEIAEEELPRIKNTLISVRPYRPVNPSLLISSTLGPE